MKIYYLSLTGNIKKFLDKMGSDYKYENILELQSPVEEASILILPTIGFGEAPLQAINFLDQHYSKIVYLVASGNKNWGAAYCGGVKKLSQQYHIPVLMQFELQGTNETVQMFKEKIHALSRA
ncbi:MAG: class Ib ribonucleoside-diphosphate reductase assembly flavoprotein NrdI [Spirochaetia bacterium]